MAALCRGRARGGAAAPAEPARLRVQAGRRAGGQAGGTGLLGAARGQEALDATAVGRTEVELEVVPELSHETVRQTLKKNALKPHLRRMWCIPPQHSAGFVFHMEDVLAVYHRPHDPQRPVVCLDECSKQLIGEVRTPLPPRPAREDRPGGPRLRLEYVRNGTANLFMAFEPLGGWRAVAVTDRRRVRTGRTSCATWWTGATARRTSSSWSWTSSTPTLRPHSMRRSRPRRPSAWPTGSRSTTPPSTAPGSTWPKSS